MAGETGTAETLLRLLIAALWVGALVLIVVIMDGSDTDRAIFDVLAAVVVLAFYCLIGSAGWILARKGGNYAFFGYATVVASVLAFAAAMKGVLAFDPFGSRDEVTAFAVTTILALGAGQASVLLAFSNEDESDASRLTRIGALLALAALAVMAIIEVSSGGQDIALKAFGVVAVLYLLGALSLPILRGLQRAAE
ncbi:MAG TPA: hypothetical protein VGF09_04730 [Solirubrobacterales bacterium]|jgi:hypothetical protein